MLLHLACCPPGCHSPAGYAPQRNQGTASEIQLALPIHPRPCLTADLASNMFLVLPQNFAAPVMIGSLILEAVADYQQQKDKERQAAAKTRSQ